MYEAASLAVSTETTLIFTIRETLTFLSQLESVVEASILTEYVPSTKPEASTLYLSVPSRVTNPFADLPFVFVVSLLGALTIVVSIEEISVFFSYWSYASNFAESTLLTSFVFVTVMSSHLTVVSFLISWTTTGKDLITFPSAFNTLM